MSVARQTALYDLIPDAEAFRVDGAHDAVRRQRRTIRADAAPGDRVGASDRRSATRLTVADRGRLQRLRTSRLARNLRLAAARCPRRRGVRRHAPRARRSRRPSAAPNSTGPGSCATAQQVADELGQMKGALMKLGQMASYLDEGLPEPLRQALSQLQSNAPPMATDLVVATVEAELGAADRRAVRRVRPGTDRRGVDRPGPPGDRHRPGDRSRARRRRQGPVPRHRRGDRVRPPQRRPARERSCARASAGSTPTRWSTRSRLRLTEELDYRIEARNQAGFADDFRGHPFIRIPEVLARLLHGAGADERVGGRLRVAGTARTTAGRARPGRRDHLPVRVPQPVHARGLQR